MVLDKDIQMICSFLLNMAFISSSEVENIYISCENIKYALYYIHIFLYFATDHYCVSQIARVSWAHVGFVCFAALRRNSTAMVMA